MRTRESPVENMTVTPGAHASTPVRAACKRLSSFLLPFLPSYGCLGPPALNTHKLMHAPSVVAAPSTINIPVRHCVCRETVTRVISGPHRPGPSFLPFPVSWCLFRLHITSWLRDSRSGRSITKQSFSHLQTVDLRLLRCSPSAKRLAARGWGSLNPHPNADNHSIEIFNDLRL